MVSSHVLFERMFKKFSFSCAQVLFLHFFKIMNNELGNYAKRLKI